MSERRLRNLLDRHSLHELYRDEVIVNTALGLLLHDECDAEVALANCVRALVRVKNSLLDDMVAIARNKHPTFVIEQAPKVTE